MIRRIGSSVLLALFVLHWAAIGLRMVPPNPGSDLLGPVVAPYVATVFEQRWMLFAPDPPTSNRRFEVRCDNAPWIDPVAPLLGQHHRWRISWHGELVRLYAQPGRDLAELIDVLNRETCPPDDARCPKQKLDRLLGSPPVRQGNALAREVCGPDVERVQFRVTFVSIRPPDGGPIPRPAVFEADPVFLGDGS